MEHTPKRDNQAFVHPDTIVPTLAVHGHEDKASLAMAKREIQLFLVGRLQSLIFLHLHTTRRFFLSLGKDVQKHQGLDNCGICVSFNKWLVDLNVQMFGNRLLGRVSIIASGLEGWDKKTPPRP